MFSVEQKRNIADRVQRILKEMNHPELPTVGEINFMLHVEGRVNWSWADIQNNAAVPIPSVNPHNEAQAQKCTPPDPQHGREPDKMGWICSRCGHKNAANNEVCMGAEMGDGRCGKLKPDKVKPLAQYLGDYIKEEIDSGCYYDGSWRELLEQALDAYESTEQVKIRIERI